MSDGWGLALDPAVRRIDGGSVLVGGSPLRILRLSPAGRRWVDGVLAGRPVPSGTESRSLARRLVDGGLAHPIPPPAGGPSPEDVTLVVPVRDRAAGLARTLAAVGPVGAAIVVDDGSRDAGAVAAVAAAAPGDVAVVRHPTPHGPAAARETGWRAADAPFVAFVDADVEPDPGWLDRLLPHLADASVAAVAPRVRPLPGAAPSWLVGYEEVRSSLDLGPVPAAVRPGGRVPYVPTAALVVRRAALDAVGGFDPGLLVGEDVDLVWRFHAAGWRLRYEPGAVVRHPIRATLATWVRQRFTYGRSAAPLAARHGRAVAPLAGMSGWSALAWGAVVAGHPAAGAGVAATTTLALAPRLRSLGHPAREAIRIAGLGNLWAGRSVADALWRAWWPLTALLAATRPKVRGPMAAALLVPPLLEWRSARPAVDPVRFIALHAVDDLAYGTGAWAGAIASRSARCLLPAFSGPLAGPEDATGPPATPTR